MTGFAALLDDAALYPPAATELPDAVRSHVRHRLAWYSDMVGPFVCNLERLRRLDAGISALDVAPLDVALAVPAGMDDLPRALAMIGECPALRLTAVEVPLGSQRRRAVLEQLGPIRERALVYLEIPVLAVTERQIHDLKQADLRLKLRTGGTSIDTFRSEKELARPILLCAAERLAFKCTAGLHHAVRQRDRDSLFERHGFLNIMLAARTAAATGNLVATAALLAERDPLAVASRFRDLSAADLDAIRNLVACIATSAIDQSIKELAALGLVSET